MGIEADHTTSSNDNEPDLLELSYALPKPVGRVRWLTLPVAAALSPCAGLFILALSWVVASAIDPIVHENGTVLAALVFGFGAIIAFSGLGLLLSIISIVNRIDTKIGIVALIDNTLILVVCFVLIVGR